MKKWSWPGIESSERLLQLSFLHQQKNSQNSFCVRFVAFFFCYPHPIFHFVIQYTKNSLEAYYSPRKMFRIYRMKCLCGHRICTRRWSIRFLAHTHTLTRTHNSTKNRVHHLTGYVPVNYISNDFFLFFILSVFCCWCSCCGIGSKLTRVFHIPYFFFRLWCVNR